MGKINTKYMLVYRFKFNIIIITNEIKKLKYNLNNELIKNLPIINENNDGEEECVANINEYQFIIPSRYISLDDLFKF